ncbi:hypothetical protein B7494_g8244 [Chlorociboria aeruginascens]|nr:hypothetical protein B7494_g8244 [Chlorociboria aeruginascens]
MITPLESVSIVGIEQLMPKPHRCSKGENCSKWRKQQRLIEAFKKEHPVSPEGGSIWVAGDPGNPLTATSARPFSDAVPSVVASSDVLGPGTGSYPAFRHLEEASLRNIAERDPQDNVKQFIKFQHMDPSQMHWSTEEPPSPPYEMFPPLKSPLHGLRGLPKLAIPPPRASSANAFMPYQMERGPAMSPDLRNVTRSRSPPTVYRLGTPFSDMDVPVTHVPIGPVSRDTSQSVPPNMAYRHAPAPIISPPKPPRTSRQASMSSGLPRINENAASLPKPQTWPPSSDISNRSADDISFQGWMKKRKTKMLRHEWHEHHFTLKGTRLAMHKDARALETLEYIDVDDYAIACSSLVSGSKLNAAFKAMNISLGNKDKKDDGAFAFQLIPAVVEKGLRLRRESKDGKDRSKTHHFAVKSRDERIDWMRELMLAKALKQKSEGFEVNVNGTMI